ncbi:MAG: MOSC domain-containing protein [Acidimicrobiia bacterium]|nr:MOSC domain-containing protein [Acidimicrobiia bacterium]
MKVTECWSYPVKSFQGHHVAEVTITEAGVAGDRRWALVDEQTGSLASAKRFATLLEATGDDGSVTLPTGEAVDLRGDGAAAHLSEWLGRPVHPVEVSPEVALSYQMTFEPTNDDATMVDIPAPPGTFLDLAPIHLLTADTLRAAAAARPDLDWDVRRFRPNLVVDAGTDDLFVEQTWCGRHLRVGDAVLAVTQPTVRCAMPLRAQPGLDRQPALYEAMTAMNTDFPSHLGVYAEVVSPGVVRTGDSAALEA